MKTITPLICAIFLSGFAAAEPYLELGPMLGHVGTDEARIWIKASGPAQAAAGHAVARRRAVRLPCAGPG